MNQAAETLNITIVQTTLRWEDKQANLSMLEEKIHAVKDRMEIVVLPEMFSTGFSMRPELLAEKMDGAAVEWMKRLSASLKIILVGSLIIEENGNYFNRLIWMMPNGENGHYDKRHLFAYAGEDKHYAAGNKRLIASVKGWKLNLQVCYDLRFPVWARQSVPLKVPAEDKAVEPEYDVLVYVANWPERRNHAWKTLLQARAIENQCYVVGVNRVGNDGNDIYHSGDSMIIDPLATILYNAADREEIFTYSLRFDNLSAVRTKLPFLRDADPFMIGNY
ncbi:MAG: nitrilase family protein [Chitinophagaceae bacterium]|nr:nitrilase family protein [Chitinophagaceae bacterium]